jgi:hypothetical protein
LIVTKTFLLLTCLLSTLLFVSQTVEAADPISKQVAKLRTGTAIQVRMADGRVLDGKLVSTSATSFQLLEPDQTSAETIECSDVAAVNKTSTSPKEKRQGLMSALLIGGMLAATGVAVALSGSIY